MSRLKPYKFHELIKKLRKHDPRFEAYTRRGKGSHRMIYHPDIDGRPVSFPVTCHGKGQQIDKDYIRDLKRAFKLPDKARGGCYHGPGRIRNGYVGCEPQRSYTDRARTNSGSGCQAV